MNVILNSELLKMSRDWLEQNQWLQGILLKDADGVNYEDADGILGNNKTCVAACALGALHWIRKSKELDNEPSGYLKSAARSLVGHSMDSVVDYNDEYGRTKQHILKLYDKAIELAKKDEEA